MKHALVALGATFFSAAVMLVSLAVPASAATTYSVPFRFCGSGTPCPTGKSPVGNTVVGADGSIYGVTESGGVATGSSTAPNVNGVVYKLTPKPAGGYTYRVIYKFCSKASCIDGSQPTGGLAIDAAGNLYGATKNGGTGSALGGVVFQLRPPAPGATLWRYRVLYSFCTLSGCADGKYPTGVAIDEQGALVGATKFGGTGKGVVFRLVLNAAQTAWKYSTLYSFGAQANDGANPIGPVVSADAQHIVGATFAGGASDKGTVFQVAYDSTSKTWAETVVHSFCDGAICAEGSRPNASAIGPGGAIYGTAAASGPGSAGTIYRILPNGAGGWTFEMIYAFCKTSGCPDGNEPSKGPLSIDASGNLFGATTDIGTPLREGQIFKLAPPASAGQNWKFTSLRKFCVGTAPCPNGSVPEAGFGVDAAGNYYGHAYTGGANDAGLVFKFHP